ncbi:TPA: dienelactone hydrolase family protein [Klebsiella pneumoniae]|nr:dienelactone hydrolase family protein [Klebsiella pneumoniae]
MHSTHCTTEMKGYYCRPRDIAGALPGLLLVHGAAGLNEQMMAHARAFAAQGYGVLAVDLWGQRRVLNRPEEFAAMITAMLSDRGEWMGRLDTARQSLAGLPEIDPDAICAVGYCFGGTSVLDYVRTGYRLRGAVSLHGGIDNVGNDWSGASGDARVLILSGVNDLMATQQDLSRVQQGMNAAGIRWEQTLYGQTRHAFTEPDHPQTPPFARYDLLADQRSWQSVSDFLATVLSAGPLRQAVIPANVE